APAFLEQPLPAGRWRDTAEVCSRSPVPIALDEELIGAGNPAALLDAIRPHHIVLKPTLVGGLAACETWINAAEARGVQWWINSLLESNVGLNAIAQWTAARGEGRVHGLGTGRLFANNIPAPLRLDGCSLQMERDGAWDFGVLRSGDEARSASSSRALAIDDHTFTRDDLLHLDLADLPPHFSDNARAALAFCRDWLRGVDEVVATTSGSTGPPKSITLTRPQMAASAHATGEALGLRAGMRTLVCLPVGYIAGQMMLVRGLALGMSMTLVEPCSDPLASLPAGQRIDFAALVPLQLQAMLDGPADRRARLDAMHAILVGGAPVSAALEDRIRTLAAPVYHTYGMTETATHIALRRLNGREASSYFQPLPGVQIEVDDRGCLRVKGPMTLDRWVQTNDLVELSSLHPPSSTLHPLSFRWLGRWDNVINSGGIKVAVEVVERAVEDAWQACGLAPRRFFVAGTPDERLGDAVTLVIEGDPLSSAAEECLVAAAAERVQRFERPRGVVYLPAFAETATGKIDRAASLARVANFSEKLATLPADTDHA
ncbi:MAG: AMP-binding protein, partial [Caldilineales bacterium]